MFVHVMSDEAYCPLHILDATHLLYPKMSILLYTDNLRCEWELWYTHTTKFIASILSEEIQ